MRKPKLCGRRGAFRGTKEGGRTKRTVISKGTCLFGHGELPFPHLSLPSYSTLFLPLRTARVPPPPKSHISWYSLFQISWTYIFSTRTMRTGGGRDSFLRRDVPNGE
ncbi:hypothetical protein NPIL_56521 [Nephila pilipes]|uniref:Uncharacterized protein n=1 Tax=Nephila pilipes TaxID=299642 RepID=A0A8X6NZK1_NEPPI|nr:hypothetical protein NPIL_56521 [Nephila pilipes]